MIFYVFHEYHTQSMYQLQLFTYGLTTKGNYLGAIEKAKCGVATVLQVTLGEPFVRKELINLAFKVAVMILHAIR